MTSSTDEHSNRGLRTLGFDANHLIGNPLRFLDTLVVGEYMHRHGLSGQWLMGCISSGVAHLPASGIVGWGQQTSKDLIDPVDHPLLGTKVASECQRFQHQTTNASVP